MTHTEWQRFAESGLRQSDKSREPCHNRNPVADFTDEAFNNRLLWSQYHTDAARYLSLYLENKVRQSSFEETPKFNFSGNVFNNIDNLESPPYAISLWMNTN